MLTNQGSGGRSRHEHHYRSGLSPERPTNRVRRKRNRRVRRTATEPQRWRSGEVLPRSEAEGSQRASRDGSHRACPLVRTAYGRTRFRVMERRSGGDQGRASPQAENGPAGCSTYIEDVGGRSLPARVGPQSGKSGYASTAVASTSAGAYEDASHEPVAGGRHE